MSKRIPPDTGADEAWSTYVGHQTAAEFIANGGEPGEYAANAPLCDDLTDAERAALAGLLAEKIASDAPEGEAR